MLGCLLIKRVLLVELTREKYYLVLVYVIELAAPSVLNNFVWHCMVSITIVALGCISASIQVFRPNACDTYERLGLIKRTPLWMDGRHLGVGAQNRC